MKVPFVDAEFDSTRVTPAGEGQVLKAIGIEIAHGASAGILGIDDAADLMCCGRAT